ncbi:MAG: flagellar basal body-associated FliL family protein [Silvania sp.]|uniref:flagellar basal body-associated FliL family protein n=1 Tax=Silvania sp. TaxID=3016633 RepID=UPI003EE449FE
MTIKKISAVMAIAVLSSVLTAGLAVTGTYYLNASTNSSAQASEDGAPEAKPGIWHKVSGFFASSDNVAPPQFVEMNNIMITLRSDGDRERYMLLELALSAADSQAVQQTEMMLPAIRGATVALFSDMEYSAVRAMHIPELHDMLMATYNARFAELKQSVPFNDVTISKMLLQ